MKVEPEQFKAFLIDSGIVSDEKFGEIQQKAQTAGQKIEDILTSEGLMTLEDIIKLKARILGLPFIILENEKVPPDVLNFIPEPLARNYQVIAYKKEGNKLEIAALEPENFQTVDYLKKTASLEISFSLTTLKSIENILSQYPSESDARERPIASSLFEEKLELEKLAEDLSVVRLLNQLFKNALTEKISEIQINSKKRETLIRYQLDNGKMKEGITIPKKFSDGLIAKIKLLASLKLEGNSFQEGYFDLKKSKDRYLVKVSIFPMMNEEKIVVKLSPAVLKGFILK